jgi:hypothetical protein
LITAWDIFHETPLDWGSFMAEQSGVPNAAGVRQYGQGTVNHVLDSITDMVANVFGMAVGYANPGMDSVNNAALWGHYIPGPGDPDPAMGGNHQYKGNPTDAWGPGPCKSW